METEILLVFLAVSLMAGFLGGMLASHVYQKNQRSRDKRRWEELIEQSSDVKVSKAKTNDGCPYI